LGLTERQFWNSTPRELHAFYRAQAIKEGRWRFYMATSMGAKHKSGRALTVDDFMPPDPRSAKTEWQDQLRQLREFVRKGDQLRSMAGKVVGEHELNGLIN